MTPITSDITIIGAGLTGLTIAYLLKEKHYNITLLEARARLGGRILTQSNGTKAPLEMGATWFSNEHTALLKLLKKLNLNTFAQLYGDTAIYQLHPNTAHQIVPLPQNNTTSYRLAGGTACLIHALHEHAQPVSIQYNDAVVSITEKENHVSIITEKRIYESRIVISTLPPNLFSNHISTCPKLPAPAHHIMQNTHTWMGDSIKIGLRFSAPFWRKNNLSSTIFSNTGPLTECYDHCNYEDNKYALIGFLKSDYFSITKQERLTLITNQLKTYYGDAIKNFLDYEELVWAKETFTYTNYNTHVFPHNNNGHSLFQKSFLNNKLYLAGTETSTSHAGKMEGAIRSAQYICEQIKDF